MSGSSASRTIIRGTGVTSALTLLSRILGFVRDLLVARAFGAGFFADAYVVAFRIPNLLRSLVGEGALTAAFVPVFAEELEKSKASGRAAIQAVSGFLLLVSGVLTIAGIGFSKTIVELFAPGFASDPNKLALCTELTQIMFPYIICVSYVAMLNGALNTVGIFGASAFAQVVMNLFLIAGALLADFSPERSGVVILSISVIAGGIAQVIAQIPALKRAGLTIIPKFSFKGSVVRDVVKLMMPATIGAAIYQVTIFLNTVMASFLAAGSVSWLFYADRLTQLPIGIFTIALASVLLPMLSKARASKDDALFVSNLENSLRYTSFILVPCCVGIFMLAHPLIAVMFERGAFDSHSTAMTALAVQGLCIGIWASSCQSMLSRSFIAKRDTITPTVLGFLVLLLNLWFGLALMGRLVPADHGVLYSWLSQLQLAIIPSRFQANFGHVGLSLATSLSSCMALLIYSLLASKRLPGLRLAGFIRATITACISAAAMGLVLQVANLTDLGVFRANLMNILLAAILGPIIYGSVYIALRGQEGQETFALIRRLFLRNDQSTLHRK